MKHLIIFAMLFLILVPCAFAQTDTLKGITVALVQEGRLRNAARYNATCIQFIARGEEVQIINYVAGGYYYIHYDTLEGYMNRLYLPETDTLKALFRIGNARIDSINTAQKQQDQIAAEKRKAERRIAEKKKQVKREAERVATLQRKYGKKNGTRIAKHTIWLGMTKEMVIDSRGDPKDINRTVNRWGVHEQWIYTNIYLYFDDGVLTAWQD